MVDIEELLKAIRLLRETGGEGIAGLQTFVKRECLKCGKEFETIEPLKLGNCPRLVEEERDPYALVYCNVSALCVDCMQEMKVSQSTFSLPSSGRA